VKHVAENHGGRVEVTSELGQGTRFEVRLPASA
jgi:signal transduction histidine kinase